jgi:hypothetical protein
LLELKDKSGIDSAVYIYQVIWSANPKDVIDSHFDTARLAEFTYQTSGVQPFDTFVRQLRLWCISQKSKN